MSDSSTNYSYVGNTKESVSIKKTYANKCTLRSRTTIVWPFFVYSKMAMFKLKNRAFRVIQHYEHHIYSESLHQKQSFKKNKNDMSCIY